MKASQIKNNVFAINNETFPLEDAINEVFHLNTKLQSDKQIKVNVTYQMFEANPKKIIQTDKTCL